MSDARTSTKVCSMTRSKAKVKVTSPSKLEILSFSKVISSTIYNGSWQLTTDSQTKGTISKFDRAGFFIFVLVFLCHVTLILAETSVAKSRPLVPYGANLFDFLARWRSGLSAVFESQKLIKNGPLASLVSNLLFTDPILELWAKWVNAPVATWVVSTLTCTCHATRALVAGDVISIHMTSHCRRYRPGQCVAW